MKTVTFGFSKSKKRFAIGSVLIRWYMHTPYSHVYMKFRSESLERTLIYEAVGAGVRFIGVDRWAEHAQEVDSVTIQIKDENYKKLMQYCVDASGIDYGFAQNFGLLFANLFKLKANPLKDGKNCSEAIGEILVLEGYVFDKELNLLTPKDINIVLKSQDPQGLAKATQDLSQK